MNEIEINLQKVLDDIKNGNNLGEEITLVGATKYVPVDRINIALKYGLKDIGENKAQEFREKFSNVLPCNYHFIGYLQKNKVKYLIGKAYLIESCDRLEIIEEINKQSAEKKVITNILLEINVGEEENKHGFLLNEVEFVLKNYETLKNIKVMGLMSMLPETSEDKVGVLCDKLRKIYDDYKEKYGFKYLSCGISGDYLTTIKHGSNMIRIGSLIFGKRY